MAAAKVVKTGIFQSRSIVSFVPRMKAKLNRYLEGLKWASRAKGRIRVELRRGEALRVARCNHAQRR